MMNIEIRKYTQSDAPAAVEIWNQVIDEGIAFPQLDRLTVESGNDFFLSQNYTGIAYDTDNQMVVGLYILHPNNVGRCQHIANTSYAVRKGLWGHHIGEKLVSDSLFQGKILGFTLMQFNAVVRTNKYAIQLYQKLGFTNLGTVPGGFLMKDGHYEDIVLMFKKL